MVKSLSMSSPPVPAVDLGASSMRPSEVRSGLGTDHTQQATIHGLQVQMPRELECLWVARACVTRVSFCESCM